jgi:hypothetical protein
MGITIGDLIQIAIIAFTVGGTYMSLKNKIASLETSNGLRSDRMKEFIVNKIYTMEQKIELKIKKLDEKVNKQEKDYKFIMDLIKKARAKK